MILRISIWDGEEYILFEGNRFDRGVCRMITIVDVVQAANPEGRTTLQQKPTPDTTSIQNFRISDIRTRRTGCWPRQRNSQGTPCIVGYKASKSQVKQCQWGQAHSPLKHVIRLQSPLFVVTP